MTSGDAKALIASAPEHRPPLTATLRMADQICQAPE
jgi:hypothetical protein